jgi:hypothetical protein
MVLVSTGKGWEVVRFKPETGETWVHPDERNTWSKIQDSEKLPAGDYEVQLVGLDNDWEATRIERNSGRTWLMRGGKWNWIEIKEPR